MYSILQSMLEWNWHISFTSIRWLIKHFTVIYGEENKQFLTLNLNIFCREKISLSGTPISLPKIADLPIWAQENITGVQNDPVACTSYNTIPLL